MPSATTGLAQAAVQQFLQACLRAIVRGEAAGRLPQRFTGTGKAVWETFRNELNAADLVALCIQDAGVTMPVPFDPTQWWPEWPDWALLDQSPTDAQTWIEDALTDAEQARDAHLRKQATLLEIELPTEEGIAALTSPQSHERWLELPGTGGWIAYRLCTRPETALYLWENFQIVCGTPQEMLLAGLIAWELSAPPRTALPIRLDGPDLMATLRSGETYQAVVGRRSLHGHRDLRVLQQEGRNPIWL